MPGKLLLTGAAGFLGTNILLELLKTEVEIFALIHNTPLKVNNPQIRILQSSLDSIEKLKNDIPKDIDAVIHCAGLTKSVVIENFYKVNFTGTKNLIEFFIKNKINIRHFIFISSISAVGPQKEKVAIDENCSCSPIKGYGESKFLAENEVKKLGGNINWTIIRPPFIFGPYDYDTLLVFKLIKYGVKLYMGQKFFSFVFSQDLAQAIIKIMDNNKSFGKTYFVCYPKYTSQTTFLNTISYFVNKNAKWVRIHPNFFVAGATLLQPILKKNSPINRIKFKEIKQNYWLCCPEKIKKELSIECKTSLENAVRKTYEWYKINNLI